MNIIIFLQILILVLARDFFTNLFFTWNFFSNISLQKLY